MRRLLTVLFFVSLQFVGLACAVDSARAQSRDERDIRALLDRFIQASNSADDKLLRQNLAEHSPSGGPYFPPFEPGLASTAEMEAGVVKYWGLVTSRSYSVTSPITLRVDKNLAWAAYAWRVAFTFKDGSAHRYEGRATVTFVREGKNWRFAHWHSSVVAPPPLTAAARDAESQKVIEVERNAWEALKSKQVAALADYFAEDYSMFEEAQAYRVRGKAEGMRALESWLQQTTLRSYQMLEPQVQLLGDTALLTYYFSESGVSGGKEFSNTGKISMVFVKQDGAWRALHEHRSVNR